MSSRPRAFVLIREQPWYRREAFVAGLRAAGYDAQLRGPERAQQGDLLVIWNRYAHWHDVASRFEAEGGRVVVAENGYLGEGGTPPKFDVHPGGPKPHHYYALGLGFHNDDTRWRRGGAERFAALHVELRPWREAGEHVLVLPNRSFGVPGRMMPSDWAEAAAKRLGKATGRPVRIRRHPGNDAPKRPLQADLEGAWAAVVWSSSAGVHALVAGIPVFCEGPHWSMRGAASTGPVDAPTLPDRMLAFQHLAWGQWQLREIEGGEPFRRLLS